MVVTVSCNTFGGIYSRLVFGSIEASHLVVHDAFECDGEDSLGSWREVLVEGDGASLVFRVIGDVRCLCRGRVLARICSDLSGVKFELMRVERDGLGRLLDFQLYIDFALVGPWLAGSKVHEGDSIVDRLDMVGKDISVGGHFDDGARGVTGAMASG